MGFVSGTCLPPLKSESVSRPYLSGKAGLQHRTFLTDRHNVSNVKGQCSKSTNQLMKVKTIDSKEN